MRNLYPRGSDKGHGVQSDKPKPKGAGKGRPGFRPKWAMTADHGHDGGEEHPDDENEEYSTEAWTSYVTEVAEAAYDDGWEEADAEWAYHGSTGDDSAWYDDSGNIPVDNVYDEYDCEIANTDADYHTALITMRESRAKMNQVRVARGFFKGRIDGTM